MSISDIGLLVNSNFNKPLNEQIRDNQWQGGYVFSETSNTTISFTPDKSGYYKIIAIGAGGVGDGTRLADNDYRVCTGGSGGVAIKTMKLLSSQSYTISFTYGAANVSFNNILSATRGTDGDARNRDPGSGGTASGGDFNYNGISGQYIGESASLTGPGVGVFIPGLSQRESGSGNSIFGYGNGGSYSYSDGSGYTGPAAVLILPLELEE